MIVASAISDVLEVNDLCTFRLYISQSVHHKVQCVVIFFQNTQEEAVSMVDKLNKAVGEGVLLRQLKKRGLNLFQ
jgi:hypothetical protein